MKDVTKGEWREWLSMPATDAFLDCLRSEIAIERSFLISGGCMTDSATETAMEYANRVGIIEGLQRAIEAAIERGGEEQ